MTLYRVEIRIGDHDRRILPIFQNRFRYLGTALRMGVLRPAELR